MVTPTPITSLLDKLQHLRRHLRNRVNVHQPQGVFCGAYIPRNVLISSQVILKRNRDAIGVKYIKCCLLRTYIASLRRIHVTTRIIVTHDVLGDAYRKKIVFHTDSGRKNIKRYRHTLRLAPGYHIARTRCHSEIYDYPY